MQTSVILIVLGVALGQSPAEDIAHAWMTRSRTFSEDYGRRFDAISLRSGQDLALRGTDLSEAWDALYAAAADAYRPIFDQWWSFDESPIIVLDAAFEGTSDGWYVNLRSALLAQNRANEAHFEVWRALESSSITPREVRSWRETARLWEANSNLYLQLYGAERTGGR